MRDILKTIRKLFYFSKTKAAKQLTHQAAEETQEAVENNFVTSEDDLATIDNYRKSIHLLQGINNNSTKNNLEDMQSEIEGSLVPSDDDSNVVNTYRNSNYLPISLGLEQNSMQNNSGLNVGSFIYNSVPSNENMVIVNPYQNIYSSYYDSEDLESYYCGQNITIGIDSSEIIENPIKVKSLSSRLWHSVENCPFNEDERVIPAVSFLKSKEIKVSGYELDVPWPDSYGYI